MAQNVTVVNSFPIETFWVSKATGTEYNHSEDIRSVKVRHVKPDPTGTTPVGGAYHTPTGHHGYHCVVDKGRKVFHKVRGAPPRTYDFGYRGFGNWGDTGADHTYWMSDKFYPHYPLVPDHIVSTSVSRANASVRSSDLQLGQALAELPSSVKTLINLSWRFVNTFKRIKRAARGDLTQMSNIWLEYQYGVRPLMNDIKLAADSIQNGLTAPTSIARATGIAKEDGPMPVNTDKWHVSDWSGHNEWIAETSYTFRVKDPAYYHAESLGLLNPAAIAWELVPLSFVVDWFAPVGAFLETLSLGIGLTFLSGYTTRCAKVNMTHTYVPVSKNQVLLMATPRTISVRSTSYRRVVLTSWAFPNFLSLRLPVGRGLGTKIVTTLALVIQRKDSLYRAS